MSRYGSLLGRCFGIACFAAASMLAPGTSVSLARAEQPAPLVVVFQKQKDPAQLKAESERVGELLSQKLAREVRVQVPTDNGATVTALINGRADLAYVDSMSAVLAARDGGARIVLAEVRPDIHGSERTEYDSVFVVRADSRLKSYADFLKDRSNISIVFSGPTSTSGFLIPMRRFMSEGILGEARDPKRVFKRVTFAGGYTQALQQVISGHADVAAVSGYSIEGASAAHYLDSEDRTKLRVLERTPGVPTHVLVARSGLEKETEQQLVNALLAISNESPELLRDVYGTAQFAKVDGATHVAATREAMELLGLATKTAG
jgi:phosphonate transport system substrate-binding protein